jgi:hypothetical protein
LGALEALISLTEQVYPDIIAQAIFCGFCEAFPQSLRRFTIDFKVKLCDMISDWFLGTLLMRWS